MAALATDPTRIFVGYGLQTGRAMGTIPREAPVHEMPVAEGLMTSFAIGLALAGRKPVVYIERADFIWHATDAIVNHLAAMPIISGGEYRAGVIIRVTVGGTQKPLFTGYTHTRDNSAALRAASPIPVFCLREAAHIATYYAEAAHRQANGESTILYEYRDLMA